MFAQMHNGQWVDLVLCCPTGRLPTALMHHSTDSTQRQVQLAWDTCCKASPFLLFVI